MCLLIAVKKGVSKSSDFLMNAIKKGSITNTDGIGYAFKRNKANKIYISKGFSNVEEFIEILSKKNLKLEDELIVHLRIGNKGAKTKAMTHPFVLSNDDDTVLSNNKFVDYPIMAHNGTLFDFTEYNSPESDTYKFARDFMSVTEIQNLLKRDKHLFVDTFKFILKTNRLAFIFPDSTSLITLGEFEEDQGYLFSNDSYKKNVYNIGGVTHHYSCQCTDCKIKRMNYAYDEEEDIKPSTKIYNVPFSSNHNPILQPSIAQIKIEETIRNGGHKVGERERDKDGLLQFNPKFDISPPTTVGSSPYISICNLSNKINLYPIPGDILYTPIRYIISQFNSTIFIPKVFNYKHFIYYNALGNDDRGINSREQYKIHEYDIDSHRIKNPVHLIAPLDYRVESIKKITDVSWFTTPEIIRYFTSSFKPELRAAYLTLYRLVQKYTVPSKNLCLQAQKAINGALKKNDDSKLSNITFKAINGCTLTGLKLFYNYQVEFMYGVEIAKNMYYEVQDKDDDNSITFDYALENLNNMS